MDKVNNSSRQAMPLWERQSQAKGHRSAVDGALKAHRQRTAERQARVQDRLNMVKQIQSDFFPAPGVQQRAEMANLQEVGVIENSYSVQPTFDQSQNLSLTNVDELQTFMPQSMDEIYSEAQLGSTNDNAMATVQKGLTNPDEGPVEDVPRGSYIDYTV